MKMTEAERMSNHAHNVLVDDFYEVLPNPIDARPSTLEFVIACEEFFSKIPTFSDARKRTIAALRAALEAAQPDKVIYFGDEVRKREAERMSDPQYRREKALEGLRDWCDEFDHGPQPA